MAINGLSTTTAAFLVSASPIASTSTLPLFKPHTILPFKQSRYADLLNRSPETEHERRLQEALLETEEWDTHRKHAMVGMQANVILQDLYVKRTQEHLQEHEERKKKKKSKKLMGDSLPKLLDSNVFYTQVSEHHEDAKKKLKAKSDRQGQRGEQAAAIAEWKRTEKERKTLNEETRLAHQNAMRAWEQERNLAKAKRCKVRWTKPKMGVLLKPVPRPKKSEVLEPCGEERCGEKGIDHKSDDNDVASTGGDESDSGDSGAE